MKSVFRVDTDTRPARKAAAALAALLTVLPLASCKQKPAEVRVTPPKAILYGFDRTATFSADVLDKKGQPVAGAKVEWTTSSPKVATVDAASGAVKSNAVGKATITATLAGSELSGKATVEVIDVSTVNVTPSRTTLAGPAGTKYTFAAVAKDSKGAVISLPLRWKSTDPRIVTVDDKGNAATVSEGKATITATAGDVSAGAEIRVVFREIGSLEAKPLTVPLKVGETAQVQVVALDKSGTPIEDVAVNWTSSDPQAATCVGGVILGVSRGSATIRALCGEKAAEVSVIVY